MPGDATIVTLSRPNCCAATPRMAPSTTPGFSSTGTDGMQAHTISSVRSRNLATSTPMIAAGTRPKSESAE